MAWEDFQSERRCKSRWREEKKADEEQRGRGEGIGGELMEGEVAGHEDVWLRGG